MIHRTPYVNTCANADLVARGKLSLVRHNGEEDSRKLTEKELVEYEAAKVRHYLIVRDKTLARVDLENCYFRWCEAANIPYVLVHVYRKFATVGMDLICMTPGKFLTRDAKGRIEELFLQHPASGVYYTIGVWCQRTKLPVDRAFEIAEALYTIATTTELLAVRESP